MSQGGEQVVIEMCPGRRAEAVMLRFPELSSSRPLIARGLEILRKNAPRFVRYLSQQRTLAHMGSYSIRLRAPAGMTRAEALRQFAAWIRGKRNRRIVYVAAELLLLVPATLTALLPGPNVIGYLLVVLLYFHSRALLHLLRIHVGQLPVTIEPVESPTPGACADA